MRAAEAGALVYGAKHDVVQMRVAPLIREIRVRRNVGTANGDRVVRLHFSEPAHEDRLRLAVELGWKPAGHRLHQRGDQFPLGIRRNAKPEQPARSGHED